MSGQLPTSPTPKSANISSEQKTITSVTTSGRVQARQIDGQKFAMTLQYPPMTRAEFSPIKAFLMKQRSRLETFTIIPPETESNTQGSVTQVVQTDGSISAGATTCTVDGFLNVTNGVMKAGDYFRFTGQNKVYMLVEDVDTNNDSEGTFTFEPPLREDVADDVVIIYDNVDFTVRLRNDVQEFSIGTTNLYQYELDVIESL